VFAFRPECCSGSQRNGVRLHTGIAFAFDRITQWNASKHREADNLVFCTRKGVALGRRNLLRHVKVASSQLGLSKAVDFRSFRTMHSSLMLREGARPEVVRDNMGHANIDVTQNVYGKSWWEERVDAVTRAVEAVATAAKAEGPNSISLNASATNGCPFGCPSRK
jgi:integrase